MEGLFWVRCLFKAVTFPFFKERDFVGLDPSTHQLCYHSSEADIEEFVNVRKSVLMEHPRVKILTDLMDAHMYILEKWVCDYLQHHE